MLKDTYLQNYEGLSYFGTSYNCKHEKYNEGKEFIAIQLRNRDKDIKTTDIIFNADGSLKSILSELDKGECIELFKWLVEWFYTEKEDIKTVITIDSIKFLSKDGNKIEGIHSNTLSKQEIEEYFLEMLETKGGNY